MYLSTKILRRLSRHMRGCRFFLIWKSNPQKRAKARVVVGVRSSTPAYGS